MAGELVSAAQRLHAGTVDDNDPLAAVENAARMYDPQRGWKPLTDWGELPVLLRLLKQLPDPKPRPPMVIPHWDPQSGVLRYGVWVARRVAPGTENTRPLLHAFVTSDWAVRISSPFRGRPSPVHDTLKRLREGLHRITFRSQLGGTMVCWEPVAVNNATRERSANTTKPHPA